MVLVSGDEEGAQARGWSRNQQKWKPVLRPIARQLLLRAVRAANRIPLRLTARRPRSPVVTHLQRQSRERGGK